MWTKSATVGVPSQPEKEGVASVPSGDAGPRATAPLLLCRSTAAYLATMLSFRVPQFSRAPLARPLAVAGVHRDRSRRQLQAPVQAQAHSACGVRAAANNTAAALPDFSLRGPWQPGLFCRRWWDLRDVDDKDLPQKLASRLPVRVIGPRGAEDTAPWPVLVLFNGFLVSAAKKRHCIVHVQCSVQSHSTCCVEADSGGRACATPAHVRSTWGNLRGVAKGCETECPELA